jgi:hypothetical protein
MAAAFTATIRTASNGIIPSDQSRQTLSQQLNFQKTCDKK